MNTVEKTLSHDQIRELLPWFVNETLSAADAECVRQHLPDCAQCRDDLAVLETTRNAVRSNDLEAIMPATTAAQLLATNDRRDHSAPAEKRSWWPAFAAAAGIAAVVLVLQLGEFRPGANNNQFETATSAEAGTRIEYVLHMEFSTELSADQRQSVIRGLADVSSWTVDESERYVINLQIQDPTLLKLEAIEKELQEMHGVQAASFVAMQLPVR